MPDSADDAPAVDAPLLISKTSPFSSPPVPLQLLNSRYSEEIRKKWASREILQKHLEADPELSAVSQAKLDTLRSPMLFITLSQALDDPFLRPAILHGWGESIRAGHPFISMIQEAAAKIDIQKYSTRSPTNAEEMAALFKRLEPHFQTEYRRLLDKMQIEEEVAQAFENYSAGDVLENYLIGYMMEYRYIYSREHRTFQPRPQK